jgi:tetratricopeptide (TPR) repeat protein
MSLPGDQQNTSKGREIWISVVLALLVLIAFEPVRHNGFVDYDDNQYLTENSHIQSGFTRESVAWAFTSGYASNWHPLTWLSHMADVQWFGLNPLGHHLHNIFLHALATVLLFLVLRAMTGAIWRSAFVAMAFGVHPLRVESVAWASERKDVLAAVFWMLTLAAYLRFVRRGGIGRYMLVVLCFALGLMAKPMLVSLPIILLALDFWPLERLVLDKRVGEAELANETQRTIDQPSGNRLEKFVGLWRSAALWQLIKEKIPLLFLAFCSCVITYLVQEHGKSVASNLPFALRLSNALTSYVAYLQHLTWPRNFGALLYAYPAEWPLWKPVAAALFLVLFSALIIRQFTRKPYLAAGWFWYGITLLPVIGLVQVGSQSMADRYSYLPSIGIFIMIAWAAESVSAKWRHRAFLLGACSVILGVGMIFQTRAQTRCWQNSIALFEHALAVTKDNFRMHYNIGWTLAHQGKSDEAIAEFNSALRIAPEFPDANVDLADILIKRGRFDEAMVHLEIALKAEPDNVLAHYNRGVIFQGREQFDEAAADYERAIQLDPENSKALNNLGILKARTGQLDQAAECFYQSLKINPRRAETHRNLAAILQMQDQFEDAIAHYREASELDTNDVATSWNLASILHSLGRLREAAGQDQYTLRLKPDHVPSLNDLAWILATTSDSSLQNPVEAASLARRACELTASKEPDLLDTLAAAFASGGHFDAATNVARQAILLAKAAGEGELAAEIDERLQLYQAAKPYIESTRSVAHSKSP